MLPKKLDTIIHDGSLYSFSMRNNKPAIMMNGDWFDLSDYNFLKVTNKMDTWTVSPTTYHNGKPEDKHTVQQGYVNFSVAVNVGGQVLTYSIEARDERQVEKLMWGRLSQELKIPIPAIRSRFPFESMLIKRI